MYLAATRDFHFLQTCRCRRHQSQLPSPVEICKYYVFGIHIPRLLLQLVRSLYSGLWLLCLVANGERSVNVNNPAAVEDNQQLARLFQTRCRVAENENDEIQVTMTICKTSESANVDEKGKGKLQ